MKTAQQNFPFEQARRVTASEVNAARLAIAKKLDQPARRSRGRPPKARTEKYAPVSIRLSPVVIRWAKRQAESRGTGYQTFINNVLQHLAR